MLKRTHACTRTRKHTRPPVCAHTTHLMPCVAAVVCVSAATCPHPRCHPCVRARKKRVYLNAFLTGLCTKMCIACFPLCLVDGYCVCSQAFYLCCARRACVCMCTESVCLHAVVSVLWARLRVLPACTHESYQRGESGRKEECNGGDIDKQGEKAGVNKQAYE